VAQGVVRGQEAHHGGARDLACASSRLWEVSRLRVIRRRRWCTSSSGTAGEGLGLYCITEGCVWWWLRSWPWGRADGIKITALKIEGVKSTPGPPDERPQTMIGGSDAPQLENTPSP
jgi:hypothetical protein